MPFFCSQEGVKIKSFILAVFTGGGGGAQNVSGLRFSHFVAPLPVINDQSLISVIRAYMLPLFHWILKKDFSPINRIPVYGLHASQITGLYIAVIMSENILM